MAKYKVGHIVTEDGMAEALVKMLEREGCIDGFCIHQKNGRCDKIRINKYNGKEITIERIDE